MTDYQDELPDDIRRKIENGALTGRDMLTASKDPDFWLKMHNYFENGGASHIPKDERQQIVGLLYQLNSDLVPAGYKDLEHIRPPLDPKIEERVLNVLDKIADRLKGMPPDNRLSSRIGLDFQAAASGESQPGSESLAMPVSPILTPQNP